MSVEGEAVGQGRVVDRLTAVLSRSEVSAVVLLAGMMLAAAVGWYWLARSIQAPWIFGDELIYSEQAKSFAHSGHLLFRDGPVSWYGLYPVLVAPAWLAGSMSTTYELAKGLNVVYMTLAAIPLYLWGRRLVGPLPALIPVALLLLMPSYDYTANIMTESAFLPLFLVFAWALARALESESSWWQVLALVAAGAAAAIRLQAVVLAAVIPTAIILKVLLDLRATGARPSWSWFVGRARAFLVLWATLAVGAVAYVLWKVARGIPLRTGLGGYESIAGVHFSLRDAARWIVFHWGELVLACGVIPAFAFALVAIAAWTRAFRPTAAERAYVAVATAIAFWLVVEVGTFASRLSFRVEERNDFYVIPLLFLGFGIWLARGMPRPSGLTAVAVLVPAALLLTVPIELLLNLSVFSDTFGLIPLYRLASFHGGSPEMRVLLGAGLVVAGIVFAVVPRRITLVGAPLLVAAFLIGSTKSVHGAIREQAHAKRIAYLTGSDPSWIDDTVGRNADVSFLYTPELDADANILPETEFWNRSVGPVYQEGTVPAVLPGTTVVLDPVTGRPSSGSATVDAGLRAPYAVLDTSYDVVGRRIAAPYHLALWKVDPPLRLASRTEGIAPDGWSGPLAAYNRYAAPHGGARMMHVTVSRSGWTGPDVPGKVVVRVGRLVDQKGAPAIGKATAARTWTIHSGATRDFSLPTPRAPYRVEVSVTPTFSPAQFGQGDTRQLGAVVRFSPAS